MSFEELLKEQEEWEKNLDETAIKSGATHKVIYWYHPKFGDDERRLAYYTGEPTKRHIGGLLRGSEIKTDYKVVRL